MDGNQEGSEYILVVLNTKTFEELKEESTTDLEASGFSTDAGSIAKLFMNIVNSNISNLYETLTVNHLRAFVTTSSGDALDAIGVLLQCTRLDDETDDNYRYRITQQCLVLASSNETAIRLTCLTVDGVKDVVPKPYAMGAGSFTVIILSDEDVTSTDILTNVETKLQKVHGYGIRYKAVSPTLNYIKIKHRVYLKDSLPDTEKQEIRYNVQIALSDYFSNLSVGDDIIVDKITQAVMNVSSDIIEEANIELYINGEKAIYVNQSCRWFERFILSTETDAVIVV